MISELQRRGVRVIKVKWNVTLWCISQATDYRSCSNSIMRRSSEDQGMSSDRSMRSTMAGAGNSLTSYMRTEAGLYGTLPFQGTSSKMLNKNIMTEPVMTTTCPEDSDWTLSWSAKQTSHAANNHRSNRENRRKDRRNPIAGHRAK